MPALPDHFAWVHVPLALAASLPVVVLGALVAFGRAVPKRCWMLVVAMQGMLVLAALTTIWTDHPTSDRAPSTVPTAFVEPRHESAVAFAWAEGSVLAAATLALFLKSKPSRVVAGLAVFGMGVGLVLACRTPVADHGTGVVSASPPAR